jgi:cytochrome c oxidase cbb3-type subunit 4
MSYEKAAHIVQTWGLVFFLVVFLGAVLYALWPGNRARFKRAARIPLEDNAGDGKPNETIKDEPK